MRKREREECEPDNGAGPTETESGKSTASVGMIGEPPDELMSGAPQQLTPEKVSQSEHKSFQKPTHSQIDGKERPILQ